MGQINPDSAFGRALTDLSRQYSTICEVGTWNGQGTTRCLMLGDAEVWSYESCPEQYQKARGFWASSPARLHLVYGTLHRKIATLDPDHPGIREIVKHHGTEYHKWHAGEQRSLQQAPLVAPPSRADVIVLDGGEFTTQGDYEVLRSLNPKVIALDDTRVFKTHDIRKELLASPEWRVLHDELRDRNGWAIFERA